jgi:hypothetical protein
MSGRHSRPARLRALAVAVAVPVILAGAFGALFWAKAVRTVASFDSPAGTWRATVRVINPGGFGGYTTHIVVARAHSLLPSRQDKVFVADDAQGTVALGKSGELPVSLRWEGDNRLLVSYPAQARVYRQETQLGPLSIAYEAK